MNKVININSTLAHTLLQVKQRPRVLLSPGKERLPPLGLERGDQARLARPLAHERDLEHALRARLQLLPQCLHVLLLSVVLADGGAPAVLAYPPLAIVLADGDAPAVLACAPPSVVLADGGAPADPRSPCTGFS